MTLKQISFIYAALTWGLAAIEKVSAFPIATITDEDSFSSCQKQAKCMELSVTKQGPTVCSDLACEYEVCLRIYKAPGENCPTSFGYTCKRPDKMCDLTTIWKWGKSGAPTTLSSPLGTNTFAELQDNPWLEHIECQTARDQKLVEFMVHGSGRCDSDPEGATLAPNSGLGYAAQCHPREAATESCATDSDVGKECVWQYWTPKCDGTPYYPGSAKTRIPTSEPTSSTTSSPTLLPTPPPTSPPTDPQTKPPTPNPSGSPTPEPTPAPTNSPTPEPTSGPTNPPTLPPDTVEIYSPSNAKDEKEPQPSGVNGDPHFKTWNGEKYDFHGICDLVLLTNPSYSNSLGMDIHVRSKKTRQWSYVSTAVLRIGDDTLEVAGRKDGNTFWVNGVEGKKKIAAATISGHQVTYQKLNEQQELYTVYLQNQEKIVFKTWKDMVRVDVNVEDPQVLAGSTGLMGSFPSGEKIGRDNKTIFTDLDRFGKEWQVHVTEPMLFHTEEDSVQAPARCEVPSKSSVRRRMAESTISLKDAEVACARVSEEERDLCIFDVMAINDMSAAGAY